MRVFILIWAKKAPAILIAVASFMIAIFFLVFFPMMKK